MFFLSLIVTLVCDVLLDGIVRAFTVKHTRLTAHKIVECCIFEGSKRERDMRNVVHENSQ